MVAQSSTTTQLHHALQMTANPFAQYYPSNWPEMPFHEGELLMQHEAGVHEKVMTYAPKIIRPYMPDQHRDFYQAQPFLVVAARDADGAMWSTLLTSPTGQADLVSSPEPDTLQLDSALNVHDALFGALQADTDLGILGIEFATKRRNRVNGRITQAIPMNDNHDDRSTRLTFKVGQSFGNCPQYIKPRQWWTVTGTENESDHCIASEPIRNSQSRPRELSPEQMEQVSQAETIFVASGYRGEGDDVRFGNDASHRGGPAGFVMVQDPQTLLLPEFAGNNIFNTLGNLQKDARMGITIPFFETGSLLQLSGTATVNMDTDLAARTYPGALRLTTFHIEQVNVVPVGGLPLRWTSETESRPLQVTKVVQESDNVKSFYFQATGDDNKPLWKFTAGQHLPIQLRTPDGEILRTYSLSGAPSQASEHYRISVKREPFGKASNYLHDHVKEGDKLYVSRPAGDFMLPPVKEETTSADNQNEEAQDPLVLLSSGIGVTPILSMLHQVVQEEQRMNNQGLTRPRRNVLWVHGARNGQYHPFRQEVQDLVQQAESVGSLHITRHVVYSQPTQNDTKDHLYDSQGHVAAPLIEQLVGGPNALSKAHVYMCGNGGFMGEMEDALQAAGVNPKNIFFETF